MVQVTGGEHRGGHRHQVAGLIRANDVRKDNTAA